MQNEPVKEGRFTTASLAVVNPTPSKRRRCTGIMSHGVMIERDADARPSGDGERAILIRPIPIDQRVFADESALQI